MLGVRGDSTDADNPARLLVSVYGVMKKSSSLGGRLPFVWRNQVQTVLAVRRAVKVRNVSIRSVITVAASRSCAS